MKKSLKRCYRCLDLPYDATEEEVISRENALVKILKSEALEKNISQNKKIKEVQNSSKVIIENIKNNGIPKEEFHRFECSNESIVALIIVCVFFAMVCFFSFYIF